MGVASSCSGFVLPMFNPLVTIKMSISFLSALSQVRSEYYRNNPQRSFNSFDTCFYYPSGDLLMYFSSGLYFLLIVKSHISACCLLMLKFTSLGLTYDTYEPFNFRLFLFNLNKTTGQLS